jgi:hypothetical protein
MDGFTTRYRPRSAQAGNAKFTGVHRRRDEPADDAVLYAPQIDLPLLRALGQGGRKRVSEVFDGPVEARRTYIENPMPQ